MQFFYFFITFMFLVCEFSVNRDSICFIWKEFLKDQLNLVFLVNLVFEHFLFSKKYLEMKEKNLNFCSFKKKTQGKILKNNIIKMRKNAKIFVFEIIECFLFIYVLFE